MRGFFSPVTPELRPVIEAPPPRLASRVLWIVVDGLRHDTALELGWMPNLMALSKQGASGTATTTAITMTGVGVRAMSTGMSSSLFDLARNWSLPRVTEDNLFRRLRDRGGRAVALGNETWFQLFPDSLERATKERPGIIKFARPVNGYDRILTKHALKLATADTWELAVLHYGGVDNASHMWTPWADKFRAKITEVDHDIGRIVAAMGPTTTVVVTSDHGTSDRGHHGGIDPVERITPLVVLGPGVRRGVVVDAQQVDLPATISALLGLQAPAPIEGHVLVDALDLTPPQAAALRQSEASRHERYSTAYAAQFSTDPRDPDVELSEWLNGVRTRWVASLAWAIAMIAAAAWVFGLARSRIEGHLSLGIIAVSLGSVALPPSVVPAVIVGLGLLAPLAPQLAELPRRALLAILGLAAIQTAALLIHTYERVIHSGLRRALDIHASWLGVVVLAACAPIVWRLCRAKQVSPWAAFALLLAFAMPGDDAALWGVVLVGGVAAIAMWHLEADWSLFLAIGISVVGFRFGSSFTGSWVEIVAPMILSLIAFGSDRKWPWLVAGVAASAMVATGRPMLVMFPAIGIAVIAAFVRRGDLARIGWGAAIVLAMLSHGSDIPGLIGLVLVCDRIGRLERLTAFGATVACLALRDAFVLVFEGRLAFGNLEIWLGYVAGNEHTVLGGLLVFLKFLLPFVVVLALVTRSLSTEVRSLAITGCVVFLVLRIAEIVIGLCTAQGTFYGPYRDVAQLAITAGLLVTLLVASLLVSGRSRGSVRVRQPTTNPAARDSAR